jgi:hypothetical protein
MMQMVTAGLLSSIYACHLKIHTKNMFDNFHSNIQKITLLQQRTPTRFPAPRPIV